MANIPQLPPGIPPADPAAPKRELTQEQIDALISVAPPWLKPWIPFTAVLIPILLAGGWFAGKLTGGITDDAKFLGGKLDTIIAKLDVPLPPDAKPVAKLTTVYVVTTATDLIILNGLAPGAVEKHPVGTVYQFGGKVYHLPVAVTRQDGVDTAVKELR